MTLSLYNQTSEAPAEASEPSEDVVKVASQREQMLRDLEQFLSFQLTNPTSVSLRLARRSRYGGKVVAGGAVGLE